MNLDEAEVLGRRGVELAPPGPERAMVLDTVAEICHARGDLEEAIELIRQAVADAPEKEYYQKQLERFEAVRAARAN